MSPRRLTCPGCGKELLDVRLGEWTLANRILVLRPEGVYVVCPTCPEQIRVPFLEVAAAPPAASELQQPGRRLVVRVPRA